MKTEELINQCIKNNRTAQNELFQQYKDTLFFTSLKYCRNQADAEDNLHDTFITIFQKIKTFKHKGSFEGWMKRITIFKAIDKYKAQKPVPIEINNDILEETVETDEETDISIDQLLKLIQELPDQYRLVFNLFQMDGFTHKEIAELMNISEGTSKSNYHRAKLILRDKVEAINNPKYSKIN
ncbi:RNA polymerase sigma factor, sigma-70 family [Aequorivita sublithincola DSM 14238]|uniref:RNA polymerase sigma factor, sigma-70 family n=1 Tax=Aequorivita sublithincola (strain DSM 14238 / LMG 21431 / ACAM 643 / 9-3) TaxID=746697 RepID=I3YST1_AEQSU|nr:sigma-70 family RNA polymerase sigma factor [Aequorivita sublithincola]AFL80049.1 RNA polymerase sigma factor, sigma-70 family [Aequorivita sublithincola DSM 14238]